MDKIRKRNDKLKNDRLLEQRSYGNRSSFMRARQHLDWLRRNVQAINGEVRTEADLWDLELCLIYAAEFLRNTGHVKVIVDLPLGAKDVAHTVSLLGRAT